MKETSLLIILAVTIIFSPPLLNTFANAAPTFPDNQYHIPLTGFNKAWQVTEGSSEVKIAVIDTGVDINHKEFIHTKFDPLSYNITEGLIGLQYVMDDGGHGTQVTGVIAANNRDAEGVSGVAPKVTIMVIKVNKIPANIYSPIRVATGIRYAADHGVHIINLSMAAITMDVNIESAIQYAASKDVLIVAAAGNNNSGTPYYPSAYDNVIAVSSNDEQSNISSFSNYGSHIDIAAPGSRINTTRYSSHDPSLSPYIRSSGTSFAAPQVAAALALVKSANPGLTASEIKDKIISTAKDAGTPGFDHYYGYGILDVKAALGINDPIIDNSISESQVSSSLISTSEFNSVDLSSSQPTTSLSSDSSMPISQPEEIKTWTVTFKVIKTIHRQEMVEDGQRVIMPPKPSIRFLRPNSKMAIVFMGWTTESGQVYDFSTPVNSDVVLIAKFKMVRIILR